MFGSNFNGNFGLPEFPFQGADQQGGLFAPNFSGDSGGNPETGGMAQAPQQPPMPGAGAQATSSAPIAPHPILNPLSSPLAPGQQPPAEGQHSVQAPAAGIGSPFARQGA